jgi:hypothetical protein
MINLFIGSSKAVGNVLGGEGLQNLILSKKISNDLSLLLPNLDIIPDFWRFQ